MAPEKDKFIFYQKEEILFKINKKLYLVFTSRNYLLDKISKNSYTS